MYQKTNLNIYVAVISRSSALGNFLSLGKAVEFFAYFSLFRQFSDAIQVKTIKT